MDDQDLKTPDMCAVDPDVAPALKILKKDSGKCRAIIMKINLNKAKEGTLVNEEHLDDVTTEEIMEALPEQQPRYIVYSFVHKTEDNRTTHPHCFIYYNPSGCESGQSMRYAGTKHKAQMISGATSYAKLTDREDLTDEWLINMLKLK